MALFFTAWRVLVLSLALGVGMLPAAQAQLQVLPETRSEALLQCLTRPTGGPEYPGRDKALRVGGMVRVKLRFGAADAPPEVEVLSQAASETIVESVQRFVRDYRLPCLPTTQTVDLVQTFHFSAVGEVEGTQTQAVPRDEAWDLERCLRTPAKAPWIKPSAKEGLLSARMRPGTPPPMSNLIVQLRFTGTGQEPEVEVVYDSMNDHVRTAMLDHIRGYRIECLPESGNAVLLEQQFSFSPVGTKPLLLKDMDLMRLLASVKGLDKQRVRFDLGTMGCPFQVRWSVGQPAVPNTVREVGPKNPNRVEFLRWLSTLTLDAPPAVFEQLLGQTVVVDMPCIDLKLDPG